MKALIILLACASSSLFAFGPEDISITDYEFRRYVKPQLRSISNEFQTLFFALNENLKPFKSAYSRFKRVNDLTRKTRDNCNSKEISDKCAEILEDLETQLSAILKIASEERKEFQSGPVEARLAYDHFLELLVQQLSKSLIKTQNLLFQKKLIADFGFNAIIYTDQLNFLYDQFHAFLFKNSDPRFRNEFNAYWVNFIRPAENIVLQENDKEYFKSQLTEFNIRWNMVNVNLTKRNYKPVGQVSTLLNIMHRRWNNILRVSLKPKG